MANIAFLGAGIMGQAMIRNFLSHGHDVTVYNRTIEKARPLEACGAQVAATPKAAAAGADVIVSSLTNDEASEASWYGMEELGLFTKKVVDSLKPKNSNWITKVCTTSCRT